MSVRYKVGDSITARICDVRGRRINLTTLSEEERAKMQASCCRMLPDPHLLRRVC